MNRNRRDQTPHITWSNVSGAAVPSYGVVKLSGYDPVKDLHSIIKPDSGEGLFYTNGPVQVLADGKGASRTWDTPRLVLSDAGEDWAVGDVVGPVEGEWHMSLSGTGFRVFSPQNYEGIAAVERVGGSGGPGDSIWFEIEEVVCEQYGSDMYVEATVTDYSGGCSAEVPGMDGYG